MTVQYSWDNSLRSHIASVQVEECKNFLVVLSSSAEIKIAVRLLNLMMEFYYSLAILPFGNNLTAHPPKMICDRISEKTSDRTLRLRRMRSLHLLPFLLTLFLATTYLTTDVK
ncbi:hypothetical protein H6F74_14715 [Trichocoleus sp. FACHB-90]|uniref:hypothetical protein n=1 Tax=Cyanophyceae TaxID=3028117 RepID=UPI0016858D37|nr:hypothetical protein [Trichocoleus sp. FACHB-90]MBD1927485.1 hypothetical protein [Trichocoleus sp. FACHB-90]